MRTSNHRVLGVALAALVAAGTGACAGASGAPSPSASAPSAIGQATPPMNAPSPAAAATSSAPATTAEPDIPAAARPVTVAGAQQFVSYWISQFNVAYQTADAKPLQLISEDTCPACRTYVAQINEMKEHGQHTDGVLWTATSIYAEQMDGVSSAVVFASIQQNPVPKRDRNGAVVERYKDRTDDLGFTLSHTGSSWRLTRVQVVAR